MKLRITIAGLFGISFLFVLWITAHAFGGSQERQVTYRYISEALSTPKAYDETVTWSAADVPLARPITPGDQALVGQALDETWQSIAISQVTGNTDILNARLTGPALQRAEMATRDAQSFGGRIVVLSQKAQPVFFHMDGSVMQVMLDMVVARFVGSGDALEHFQIARDTGVATLMNESNGWRLYSYERLRTQDLHTGAHPWTGRADGLNYYPSETPWHRFWPNFNAAQIEQDFQRLRGMGAGTVRIFVTRKDFIDPETRDDAVRNLTVLLDLAAANGLRVIPTLFDLKQDYNVATWSRDALYLEKVLPVLAQSDAVAFVDLKNEPDLDFAIHGTDIVSAWLHAMIALTRDLSPGLSLTIGWSAADVAGQHADALDVISYHDYAPASSAADRLDRVRTIAGPKPVVITEIGVSSSSAVNIARRGELVQARKIEQRLSELRHSDGVLIWSMYDFAEVDPDVVGKNPWVQRLQKSFGLISVDGEEKPAARIVRSYFLNNKTR